MATVASKPYPVCNFLVDLGLADPKSAAGGVLEVVFPEARLPIQLHRHGNDPALPPFKQEALASYGNLILRRGATGLLDWYQWWAAVRQADPAAIRTVTVSLLDEARTAPVLVWKFLRARPVNYQFSPLNALSSELLTETLEIGFEQWVVE